MLSLTDVHTYYGKSHILHGVSLEVGPGEVVGLLGRNGVGKSTTLKSVMGLARPAGGRVTFEGRDITGLAPHHLAGLGIAWVPEDRRIFRLLTVLENLRTGLDRAGVDDARRAQLLDKVYAVFPVLRERRHQAGGTLSGGEQQMLAIARAMMLEPKIILLDEPTEGLMPRMVSQIRDIIDVLHREGVAILLVEQNVPLTLAVSNRIYIMEKGVVRHQAPAAALRADHDGHPPVPGSVSVGIPVEQILVQTVNGLVNGMILALVASGLTLIFGIMDVVNFAHGDLVMLGGLRGGHHHGRHRQLLGGAAGRGRGHRRLRRRPADQHAAPAPGARSTHHDPGHLRHVAGAAEVRAVAVGTVGAQPPGADHRPLRPVLPAIPVVPGGHGASWPAP